MTRKRTKKKKFKVLISSTISLVLISLILWNLFSVWSDMIKINKEKEKYQETLSELKEENEYLNTEIIKLQDPDYIARYAREQYLYSKEGEYNIRIN